MNSSIIIACNRFNSGRFCLVSLQQHYCCQNEGVRSFSQIDVQLKRRTDLIPNLVETVKGYAKHEKELFEKVTEERANLVSAKGALPKS